jgi:hypothetical protein
VLATFKKAQLTLPKILLVGEPTTLHVSVTFCKFTLTVSVVVPSVTLTVSVTGEKVTLTVRATD